MKTEKCAQDSIIIISRIMLPEDANAAGIVHGGVIMKEIDNAAGVAAVARLAGASDFQVGRILNHARESVTGEHYNAYEYYREKRAMLDAWADYLRTLIAIR